MSVLHCCVKLPCVWMLGQENKSHCFAACTSLLMKHLGHLLGMCWSRAICQLCPHACCLSCCNTDLFWELKMLMLAVPWIAVDNGCWTVGVWLRGKTLWCIWWHSGGSGFESPDDWLFWLWLCVVFRQMLGQMYSGPQLVLELYAGTCLQQAPTSSSVKHWDMPTVGPN